MATGKRYYWIKLKDNFMNSDEVDYLMEQQDGANYVVLYQMLCLKTINTGGKLERHIGEIIIPFDEAKIQRETKWFSIDTIRVALTLYRNLGLIYEDQNGVLALANYDDLVGSETDWSEKKRRQRNEAEKILGGDNVPNLVPSNVQEIVPIEKEIRDKRIEIEDKEKDKKEKADRPPRFVPPTVEEVRAYCMERNNGIDPEAFIDFYQSKHWKIGKDTMHDWKAAVRTWEHRRKEQGNGSDRVPNRVTEKKFNIHYDVE